MVLHRNMPVYIPEVIRLNIGPVETELVRIKFYRQSTILTFSVLSSLSQPKCLTLHYYGGYVSLTFVVNHVSYMLRELSSSDGELTPRNTVCFEKLIVTQRTACMV
jgi:hypothetical protein